MLGAIDYEDGYGLIRFLEINELDEKTRGRAKEKFLAYQEKGVVQNQSYDDEIWTLKDELETVRLKFCYDRALFDQCAASWTGFGLEEYVELSKAFAALCLGNVVLPSIREAVKATRVMARVAYDELPRFLNPSPVNSFLSLLPKGNPRTEELMEMLDAEAAGKKKKRPRKLRPFRDYIRFHNAVMEFWGKADNAEKLYYFPVYLWWVLTTTLPLRPTEFLLTPRDCLELKNGADIITVRRTRLKKKTKGITYRLADDYEQHKYEIPGWMADEIRRYMEGTAGRNLAGAGLLFVPEGTHSRYFSYDAMRRRLAEFSAAAGFTGDRIHMGDTRHLAMINLILSGGSPSVCRELAGHEDISVSSNYYANLSGIVKEAVYDYSHRNTGGVYLAGRPFYPVAVPDDSVRVDDGWCCSTQTADGGIGDCIKTFSAGGGIGDCRRCPYYYPDHPGVRLELEHERQKAVDEDGAFLVQMIEQVRKGNGNEESIRAALSRLQNTSHDYGTLLYRRYREEYRDGKNRKA